MVIRLVELEGDVGVAFLHAVHDRYERVLVVGVVVRQAVNPRHEVELELANVVVVHETIDDADEVTLERRVGCVPHAETGVVLDLGSDIADGEARPVRVSGVRRRCHVELDRRHP